MRRPQGDCFLSISPASFSSECFGAFILQVIVGVTSFSSFFLLSTKARPDTLKLLVYYMYHTSPLDQTDVVFSIFSFLEVYEIAKCSRVCKFWCNLLRAPQSEDFWEKTYNSRYKRFATSIPLDLTVNKHKQSITNLKSVNWRTRCYRRALADANWSVGSFSKRFAFFTIHLTFQKLMWRR